tara:strand:+ start:205 stop:705 length:501 start_codon:yes stop_codon:yes gene_type:complete
MSEEIKGSRYALGHAVRIKAIDDSGLNIQFKFQNFFINQVMTFGDDQYTFVPFGFSGVTVNRTGDGLEATLVFPNNDLTRGWAVNAINDHYVMEVDVLIVDSDSQTGSHTRVHSYIGQVVGGNWDNVSLNLQLSSVLDAVGTDVPRRSLTRNLVGNLPVSNNVRLQ